MDGVKTDDGDGDGAEKTADKDDLNDTKVDKNEKAEKEKKRQAYRGKLFSDRSKYSASPLYSPHQHLNYISFLNIEAQLE